MPTTTPARADLPVLPHWEIAPEDLPSAIRQIKTALRARITATGRSVEEVFAVIERRVREQVEQIAAEKSRGETVWPVVHYADIAAGTVTADELARLRQRGCLIVRSHFDRDQALGWDQDIVRYVESNRFFETYRGPGDDFFGSVGSKPEIYPIYWSLRPDASSAERPHGPRPGLPQRPVDQPVRRRAVVRPAARLALPRPDPPPPRRSRFRRPGHAPGPRHPGPMDDTGVPAGLPAPFRRHRRGLRPVGRRLPHGRACNIPARRCARRSAPSRAGQPSPTWTTTRACSTPSRSPRPWATSCCGRCCTTSPDDDMCGVTTNKVFPVSDTWQPLLLAALTGIPDVRAGDSVWWHCDMIHSVAPVQNQKGWGNVMYIPAAPWCPAQRALRGRRPRGIHRLAPAPATSPPRITSGTGPTGSTRATSTRPADAASASCDLSPTNPVTMLRWRVPSREARDQRGCAMEHREGVTCFD